MLLLKPSVEFLVPIDGRMGKDMARLIERIGRVCWKSEGKRTVKLDRLMADPEFDPGTFSAWQSHDLESVLGYDRAEKASDKVTGDFIKFIVKSGHESVLEHVQIPVQFLCDRATSHQLVRHRIGAFAQESQRWCDYETGGHVAFVLPRGAEEVIKPGTYEWRFPTEHDSRAELLMFPEEFREVPRPPSLAGTNKKKYASDTGAYTRAMVRRDEAATRIAPAKLPVAVALKIEAFQRAEDAYMALRAAGAKPEDARCVLPNAAKTEIVATFNIRQWRHVFTERARNSAAQKEIRELTGMVLERFLQSPLAPAFEDFR